MSHHDEESEATPKPKGQNWVAILGNFSIQYNLSCASIAFEIMQSHRGEKTDVTDEQDYPPPGFVKYTLLGLVFAGGEWSSDDTCRFGARLTDHPSPTGAVCGMMTMGYLGDLLGRRRAMNVTLAFTVG